MALADDVLDMSKLESGRLVLEEVSFDLLQLMADVTSLVNAQLLEMKLSHHTHRKNLKHTILPVSYTHLLTSSGRRASPLARRLLFSQNGAISRSCCFVSSVI